MQSCIQRRKEAWLNLKYQRHGQGLGFVLPQLDSVFFGANQLFTSVLIA